MVNKKEKVLVALSGGVDSAVTASLLVSKGYNVTAAYMVNYDGQNKFGETCWVPEYRDAVRVAAEIGIPILKLDFQEEYKQFVLEHVFKEYEAGRTPNPDILCNKFVKFGAWLKKAQELGFDYLATGHYASIKILKRKNIKIYQLIQAKDKNKDQTYFLHQLTQEQLQNVMFPIGNYTKPQVRKLAKKFKLPVAEKEESMGICFVGEVPMKEFLMQKIKPKPGKIIMYTVGANGHSPVQVGEHDGLPFYTIGQRHIGVASGSTVSLRGGAKHERRRSNPPEPGTKPLYVVDKKFDTNELVVGFDDDPLLYKKEIQVREVNWISGQSSKFPLKCQVRLRHRQELQDCIITQSITRLGGVGRGELEVKFTKPQRAVTPGQFTVFYKQGECLGGGVIK